MDDALVASTLSAIEALRKRRILVVLDDIDAVMRTVGTPSGCVCSDPAWDKIIAEICQILPGTRSRLLVTSRHAVAALAGVMMEWITLGPLSQQESALLFQSVASIRKITQEDSVGSALAGRALLASEGHPATLRAVCETAGRSSRSDLMRVVANLEGIRWSEPCLRSDPAQGESGNAWEALAAAREAIDHVILNVSAEARQLLFTMSRASERVSQRSIFSAWRTRGPEPVPLLEPLLNELFVSGLVTMERAGRRLTYGTLSLVASRIGAWASLHRDELGGLDEQQIWRAYGTWHAAEFRVFSRGERAHWRSALEAGRRAVRYLTLAGAFEILGTFVSELVTGMAGPSDLDAVIEDLLVASASLPSTKLRWHLHACIGDALNNAEYGASAGPFFERAARAAEESADWGDVGWICHNWANALAGQGRLDEARDLYQRSALAAEKAGRPRIYATASKLASLRLDVSQGRAAEVITTIEEALVEVQESWESSNKSGEASDGAQAETLQRTYAGALDVAADAYLELGQHQQALDVLARTEALKRRRGASEYDLSHTEMKRFHALAALGLRDEAESALRRCLRAMRCSHDARGEAMVLAKMADLAGERGDVAHAVAMQREALAIQDRLDHPQDRATGHNNMGTYLWKSGDMQGALRHLVAAAVYKLVRNTNVKTLIRNLAVIVRTSLAQGAEFELPRVSSLVESSEFTALSDFLRTERRSSEEVQQALDYVLRPLFSPVEN
jgi:tetratricopeptide (TPR) repeat protein